MSGTTRNGTAALAVIAAMLAAGVGEAATITYVGAVESNAGNEATEYYTTTTPKTLDADGDDRYGTDGYDLFGVAVSHPAYSTFQSIGSGIAVVGPFFGYAVVDHPAGGDTQVRTTTNGPGNAGDVVDVITYRVTNAALVPYGFRIGIFTDGLDAANWASQAVHVVQTFGIGGGLASVDVNAFRDQVIDMVFFDLTGLATNDEYTLRVAKAPNNAATLQGAVWDSLSAPVPTPAALPAGLAMLAFAAMRRRR